MQQVCCVLLVSILAITLAQEDEGPAVTWQEEGGGQVHVQGSWMRTNKGKMFASFQGVPYASPPILQSRFLRPVKLEYDAPWTDIDARGFFKTICPQPGDHPGVVMSEDCLYLNIYTSGAMEDLKPVMVRLHGGAFAYGDGSWDTLGPQHFLDLDVVVVTLNYRLGALGFLSLGNDAVPGNMGLWDQNTALTWVHHHIVHFGGDPDQVTLCGESAGSRSILYHLLSKQSHGLFQRIIGESGSPISTSWGFIPAEIASHNGNLFAEKVGCDVNDLKCFQDLPLELLLSLNTFLDDPTDHPNIITGNPWNGVVDQGFTDDPFLADTPINILTNGDFDKNIQVILGANQDECLADTIVFLGYPELYNIMSSNWDHYGPITVLGKTGLGDITEEDKMIAREVLEYYIGSLDNFNADHFNEITNMKTDGTYWHGIETVINLLTVHGVQVHQYIFSYRGEHSFLDSHGVEPGTLGVAHADELFYLFDPLYHMDLGGMEDSDIKIRDLLVSLWVSFAKYGDPTPPGSALAWAPVSPDNRLYMNISGADPTMQRAEYYEDRMLFWSSVSKY